MDGKIKVITFVGTRPEIIRLSCTLKILDKYTNHILVHTGQNYDYELNQIFFEDLGLRKPDYFLNAGRKSFGATIGDIFKKSEEILRKERPDAFLVLGDTNSCLAAYIAKRLKIPVYHLEAGNRCFDFNVPEEINRKIIDSISDFNLVYTEHARRNLINEGFPLRRIYLIGSPMNEVILSNKKKITDSKILSILKLAENKYFAASFHREENVENDANLRIIIEALNNLSEFYKKDIIISTHPRTRLRLKELKQKISTRLKFMKPFSFSDYIKLQKNAICTISDSGTISEEASILNFPAVTIRNAMERPEAMDTGAIILTGINTGNIINSVNLSIKEFKNNRKLSVPDNYQIQNTSERVIKIIQGTVFLSNKWNGIEKN